MIVTTLNDLPGRRVTKVIGVARGLTLRSRSALGNLGGAIQSIFGGSLVGLYQPGQGCPARAL